MHSIILFDCIWGMTDVNFAFNNIPCSMQNKYKKSNYQRSKYQIQ